PAPLSNYGSAPVQISRGTAGAIGKTASVRLVQPVGQAFQPDASWPGTAWYVVSLERLTYVRLTYVVTAMLSRWTTS
ncbi:MAG TPA: hypothetical protein VHB99_04470, partial [Pirellulales bacterium]|nr:hypothetical protein [Pirellulales bacterium]